MIKTTLRVLSLIAFLILTGCASVQYASPELDSEAKAFKTSPDKATIYLYRNETMGAAVTMDVYLDDTFQGYTGANSYFMWVVEPGSHVIKSVAEDEETVTLETEPNKQYFVWQEVKMGLMSARNDLHIVDEEQGMKGVKECKLVDVSAAEKILASRNKSEKSGQ